jgi:hypothetical protein
VQVEHHSEIGKLTEETPEEGSGSKYPSGSRSSFNRFKAQKSSE